jgi:thioredoxin-related protein
MKKLLFFILFFETLFAGEIIWEKDWEKALQKAKSENLPIMMVVTGEHCGACEWFHEVTFQKETIVDEVSRNFVATTFDKNYLPIQYRAKGTPSTLFFTPEGKKIRYVAYGALNYKKFLPILQTISGKFRKE